MVKGPKVLNTQSSPMTMGRTISSTVPMIASMSGFRYQTLGMVDEGRAAAEAYSPLHRPGGNRA